MEKTSHELKITQKQISKQLEFSDSTIKRYRDDIYMNSPYKRKKIRKRILPVPNQKFLHQRKSKE